MGLTTVFATALALGLFVILPTWAVDWTMGKMATGASYGESVVRNLVEGFIRLFGLPLKVKALLDIEGLGKSSYAQPDFTAFKRD